MDQQVKNNQILDLPQIQTLRYENLFNVYTIKKEGKDFYFYNLNNKIILPKQINSNFLEKLTVPAAITWPTLSYKIYGTIFLWYLLYILNVKDGEISFTTKANDEIVYIQPQFLNAIVQKLNE